MEKKIRIGFIPSHRSPFNKQWAIDMKKRTIKTIEENVENIELIYPDENLTDDGLVTFIEDSKKVIKLFREKEIDGILIGMMTFGEEIPNLHILEAFENKPIQLFGTKEGPFTNDGNRKSDSFCGTISTASGLVRRKIKFDFSGLFFPEEKGFLEKFNRFIKVVNAYNNFYGMKIGTLGPRPAPFETCAINEVNLTEKFKIKVVPYTLLKLKADIDNIKEKEIKDIKSEINESYNCSLMGENQLNNSAKLEHVLKKYAEEEGLDGFGIQCWTAMQEEIGISPCMTMGRLTDSGIMSACEVDVHGAITMVIQFLLTLKINKPHFIDWTIQNQEDDNTFLAWHCGNAPTSLKCENCTPQLNTHSILGEQIGFDKSFGTAEFQLKDGPVNINRLVEIDNRFKMLSVAGNAETDNRTLRGSWKWIKVENLEKLYRTIIEEGFTHHASMIFEDLREEMKMFCKFTGMDIIEE